MILIILSTFYPLVPKFLKKIVGVATLFTVFTFQPTLLFEVLGVTFHTAEGCQIHLKKISSDCCLKDKHYHR
jgi:hypothetical protein